MSRLMSIAPYQKVLQQRALLELTDELCSLLNQDWTFYGNMKYAAAQLLAGSIMMDIWMDKLWNQCRPALW